jgi:hypothetical protein
LASFLKHEEVVLTQIPCEQSMDAQGVPRMHLTHDECLGIWLENYKSFFDAFTFTHFNNEQGSHYDKRPTFASDSYDSGLGDSLDFQIGHMYPATHTDTTNFMVSILAQVGVSTQSLTGGGCQVYPYTYSPTSADATSESPPPPVGTGVYTYRVPEQAEETVSNASACCTLDIRTSMFNVTTQTTDVASLAKPYQSSYSYRYCKRGTDFRNTVQELQQLQSGMCGDSTESQAELKNALKAAYQHLGYCNSGGSV